MSQDTWPYGPDADLADLTGRRDGLRQAAGLPGADPRALLDAAFAELDAAVEALTELAQAGEPDRAATEAPASLSAERTLLRAIFQHAPAPCSCSRPTARSGGRTARPVTSSACLRVI